jgi:hypothetical protein
MQSLGDVEDDVGRGLAKGEWKVGACLETYNVATGGKRAGYRIDCLGRVPLGIEIRVVGDGE